MARRSCRGWGTYGVGQGGTYVAVTCGDCDSTRKLKSNLRGEVQFPPHFPVYNDKPRKPGRSGRRAYFR